jgi:hypothetical protein
MEKFSHGGHGGHGGFFRRNPSVTRFEHAGALGLTKQLPVYPVRTFVAFEIFCADVPEDMSDGEFSQKAAKITKEECDRWGTRTGSSQPLMTTQH